MNDQNNKINKKVEIDLAELLKNDAPYLVEDGKVNLDKLKALLTGKTTEKEDDRFYFNWAGKDKVFQAIQAPAYSTLVPVKDKSIGWDETENLMIVGENLETLKLLLKPYFGKVKVIYIDPPYNRGKDYIYNDDFSVPLKRYLEMSGQTNSDGEKLTTNTENNGRFHSDWLNSMYPRLFMARNLLKREGVIFVSIDDNEMHHLRMMMDDIFGEDNFVAQFIWEGAGKNDANFVSVGHDYVLCYTRDLSYWKEKGLTWRLPKEGLEEIYKKEKELREAYGDDYQKMSGELQEWYSQLKKTHPSWQHRHYSKIDKKGVYFPDNISWPGGGGPKYDVIHPITKKSVKVPSRGWVFSSQEKMEEKIAEGRVVFGKDEHAVPQIKRYLFETEGYVPSSVIYLDRRGADKRLRALFDGVDIFDSPKDENLLKKLLAIGAPNENEIVLDFFAGSGTTGHAVFEQNMEGSKRKFILVQIDEPVNEKEESGKNAKKLGLDTIADVCIERLKRVSAKNNNQLKYKVFRLSPTNFNLKEEFELAENKDLEELKSSYLKELGLYVDQPIVATANTLDIVYEIILKNGFSLNSKIEELKLGSNNFYKVIDTENELEIHISLDAKIEDGSVEAIRTTENKGKTFVFYDNALTDSQKINLNTFVKLQVI
jgi:adenine-specific DNA-methyltransferase